MLNHGYSPVSDCPLKSAIGADGAIALAATTVIVRVAEPVRPPLSVTAAVMVWVPTDSVRDRLPPVPSAPSRFDVQASAAVRLPSCVSLAVPVKVTAVPSTTEVPLAGAVMLTTGAVLLGVALVTVTVRVADPVRPPLSVTAAVIVCVPTDSVRDRLPPVPNAPSRFDVQVSAVVRLPSCVSLAVPVKVTAVPSTTDVPLAGAVMLTTGAVLPLAACSCRYLFARYASTLARSWSVSARS